LHYSQTKLKTLNPEGFLVYGDCLIEDLTLEQAFAAALIQTGEPLPLDLAAKLMEQGIILDEFIESHINK